MPFWRLDARFTSSLSELRRFGKLCTRAIYTTNAVESLNMSLRKVTKTRGSFPTQEAALKLPDLALEHVAKKWTMPVQNWKAALQRFAILLGDRVPRADPA